MPVHRCKLFFFSYVFAFSYSFESIVNAVKMKHKLSFTETLHYSLYEFLIALSVLFGFYVSFPCSTKKRKCSTWVQNEILDISLSLGEEIEPLWYTNTHTNTLTDSDVGWHAWNSISFPGDLMQDLVKGAARLLTKHLIWMQFSSLTHFPSTALKVGVWTELYAHLFSLLMILFLSFKTCGQKKETGQLASCFCASASFTNKWTWFSDEMYRAWIFFLFSLIGHLLWLWLLLKGSWTACAVYEV